MLHSSLLKTSGMDIEGNKPPILPSLMSSNFLLSAFLLFYREWYCLPDSLFHILYIQTVSLFTSTARLTIWQNYYTRYFKVKVFCGLCLVIGIETIGSANLGNFESSIWGWENKFIPSSWLIISGLSTDLKYHCFYCTSCAQLESETQRELRAKQTVLSM